MVLDRFSPATREWFAGAFAEPTPAQLGAWEAISSGRHALVVAPTGSGKTLAAFLWSIDRLITQPREERRGSRVLYISPLKALGVDVERNLRSPLVGVTQTARRLGLEVPEVTVGVRSGDTTPQERRALVTRPPDILITTPESLFLMLTSAARATLADVDTVIIDEVHAVAATKRGAHLAVSLERLDALLPQPAQRIGLSATVRPLEEVGRFLGGRAPVTIVQPPAAKTWDLIVEVPVDDMSDPGAGMANPGGPGGSPGGPGGSHGGGRSAPAEATGSIWPHVEEAIARRILDHRSTIVFANSRRLAERLTARLNEIVEEWTAESGRTDIASVGGAGVGGAGVGGAGVGSTGVGSSVGGAGVGGTGVGSSVGGAGVGSTEVGSTGVGSESGGDGHVSDGWARTGDDLGDSDRGDDDRGDDTVRDTRRPLPSVAGGARRPPAQIMAQSGATAGAPPLLARAHHGSVSKEQRAQIEDDLKTGRLRCVVATSSLELGIDMGAVDLVIQVESPPSVAAGLQRVGRAGHQVGEVSRGILFPKHRTDLLHSAVAVDRMRRGEIESIAIPQNPLDVLAQQTIAAAALDTLDVEEWFDTVRRSAPFATLPRSAFDATLDLISGLYPSDEFAELRARVTWDRVQGTLSGRPGAQRLAVTSGGTIPDRGLFGVFIVGTEDAPTGGRRVGELDEEMVYESRVGDVFALGTTSWRIEDITHDRVLVSPAFGQPGRVPFWKGDGIGRPAELGEAIGRFTHDLGTQSAATRIAGLGLDERAAANLSALVREQRESTGHVPTDRVLVVERFRDELGDWRLVLHSPYGMPVHAPWALAVGARVREQLGVDGAAVAADDGIVVRIPDTDAEPPGAELFLFEADELEQLVTDEVGGSALFAARFREAAARALLLPRRDPGRRSPLWQQRQRASQLLDVARKYPGFPIILETVREVLRDVYDLPALLGLTRRVAERTVRVVEVETPAPSPFARSLLFGYIAAFLYEGDSPLAERRTAALSIDPTLLSELLGRAELRELLDPAVIAQTEAELQRLAPDRRARDSEGVVDLLRMLGPLSLDELSERVDADALATPVEVVVDGLIAGARALRVTVAGIARVAAIEDASRLRDALGVALPIGVPAAFVEAVDDPLGDLVSRFARTHGPFESSDVATRFGLGVAVVGDALRRLASERRVVEGEFRPGGSGTEWVSAEVLRRLRARSLAAVRREVEPVDQAALARFLPEWQHVGGALRGVDGVAQVIEQLAGVALPASAWETLVLPSRVRDYTPAWLDELTVSGEVIWCGQGSLPGGDGWVSLHLADSAALTLPVRELVGGPAETQDTAPGGGALAPLESRILDVLSGGGAYFFRQLSQALNTSAPGAVHSARGEVSAGDVGGGAGDFGVGGGAGGVGGAGDFGVGAGGASGVGGVDDAQLAEALWGLVWAGLVTNDSLAPLRARLGGPARVRVRASRRGGRRSLAVAQSGPPVGAGRWSLVPTVESDTTVRAKATAEMLLERHGVVTRGAVVSEGIRGGFGLMYKVLSGFEEQGRARRGYFVAGLGGAQFATGPTVDRLRTFTREPDRGAPHDAVCLAATDPANPFGAALPWPAAEGHRPGRKAGALVVIVDGALVLYVERGGKSVLTFSTDPPVLAAASAALAGVARRLGRMRVERVDGDFAVGSPLGIALTEAGFAATPQGLRLRP